MIRQYLKYLWKKTYKLILIAFVVFVLLYPVVMLVNGTPRLQYFSYGYDTLTGGLKDYAYVETNYRYIYHSDTLLYMLTVLAMVSAYLIPIVVMAVFQNKKRCDTLLALPMKKRTQILVTSLYGFVAFLAIWWLTALLGLGTSFIVNLRYNVPYFFAYLLCMSVLSFGVFGITTLFTSLVNNVVDSVLMVLVSMAIPLGFNYFLKDFLSRGIISYTPYFSYYAIPISAADRITTTFQKFVAYRSEGMDEFILSLGDAYDAKYFLPSFGIAEILPLIVIPLLGLASYGTSLLIWNGLKSENMQTPSQRWYSYPLAGSLLAMPLFYIASPILEPDPTIFLLTAILIVAYFVGFFIFQRKIKFNKTNLIAFAATFLPATIFAIVKFLIR